MKKERQSRHTPAFEEKKKVEKKGRKKRKEQKNSILKVFQFYEYFRRRT